MKRAPFLPYAVGVWVTAYARQDLKAFMWIVGRDLYMLIQIVLNISVIIIQQIIINVWSQRLKIGL